MNDPDLEAQLRALRPAAPSPQLVRRIARELASPVPAAAPRVGVLARPARGGGAWRWWRDLGWAAAGAAAALVAAAHFSPTVKPATRLAALPAPVVPESAFEPAGTTHELIATEDSWQSPETAEGPVREVRYSFRERHAWTNPRTGARLEIEVPREDVYLVPASLQ